MNRPGLSAPPPEHTKPMSRPSTQPRRPPAVQSQRGAVLIFALIALVILLIGAVAMTRSMNIGLTSAGNYAFKRDLGNQADRALAQAMAAVTIGPLSVPANRLIAIPAANYSPTMLANNAQGLPLALLTDAAFGAVGTSANDINLPNEGITLRYVIDQLCAPVGAGVPLPPPGPTTCTIATPPEPQGGSSGKPEVPPDPQVVFRVSIRVSGPRGTQSFFQAPLPL